MRASSVVLLELSSNVSQLRFSKTPPEEISAAFCFSGDASS